MRVLLKMAFKDIRILLGDKVGVFFVLFFPILMALLMGTVFGGSGGGKPTGITVAIIDKDNSRSSREFVDALRTSESLEIFNSTEAEASEAVRRGDLNAYIVIPVGFGDSMKQFWKPQPELNIGMDPSRTAQSWLLQGLMTQAWYQQMAKSFMDPKQYLDIIDQAGKDIEASSSLSGAEKLIYTSFFSAIRSFLSNATLTNGSGTNGSGTNNSTPFQPVNIKQVAVTRPGKSPASAFEVTFPSGILWGIIGAVASFAVTLVRERREGTWTRLRVAPISLTMILAGKAAACFITSVGVATVLIMVSQMPVFGVHVSDPLKLALAMICTALCFVGITMLMSAAGRTEQGVSGMSWGVLMIMAMFGGCTIPLFVMPGWMQMASNFSPVKWGIYAFEGAIWRGFSYAEMALPCLILLAVGAATFAAGIVMLKRSEL
ncbi:MAG: ABC transporter permease [Candidatus Brocadiia bacterium]